MKKQTIIKIIKIILGLISISCGLICTFIYAKWQTIGWRHTLEFDYIWQDALIIVLFTTGIGLINNAIKNE